MKCDGTRILGLPRRLPKARLFSNRIQYLPWALLLVNVLLRWSVKLLVRRIECHSSTVARAFGRETACGSSSTPHWPSGLRMQSLLDRNQGAGDGAARCDNRMGCCSCKRQAQAPRRQLLSRQTVYLEHSGTETGTGLTIALLINSLLPQAGIYLRGAWEPALESGAVRTRAVFPLRSS